MAKVIQYFKNTHYNLSKNYKLQYILQHNLQIKSVIVTFSVSFTNNHNIYYANNFCIQTEIFYN